MDLKNRLRLRPHDPSDTIPHKVRSMNQPDHNTNETPAPAKRPTILRRLLSHHELATLLLLLHAGVSHIRLTPEGNAVLRGLGVK
jgi:hypothetical protein